MHYNLILLLFQAKVSIWSYQTNQLKNLKKF